MKYTLKEIKENGIKKYFRLIDGYNDDTIGRCTTMQEVKEIARAYDDEIDGCEWDPILVVINKNKPEGKRARVFDNWTY